MALRKYCVAESSPPLKMPLASCTDMPFTAPRINSFASGTAASAARFIDSTKSSACFFMPNARIIFAAFCIGLGKGIFTLALEKNPFSWPSFATAASAPCCSESFKPAVMSAWLN